MFQEVRLQFAGAIPLSKQEKFSKNMIQLQQDKAKMEHELKEVTTAFVFLWSYATNFFCIADIVYVLGYWAVNWYESNRQKRENL